MKLAVALFCASFLANICSAQVEREISWFTRVTVSDGIDIVLQKGKVPELRLEYWGADPHAIITENKGNRLSIYMDEGTTLAEGTEVTVYLTYTTLKELTVLGNSHVVNKSPIMVDKFVLKSFGSNIIRLQEVQARKWRAAFYGENEFSAKKGKVVTLRVKEAGDNKLNFRQVTSDVVKVVPWVILGEGPRKYLM